MSTAYYSESITPSDSTDLTSGECDAIYVGTGGNVSIYPPGSTSAVTFKNLASGFILLVHAKRVMSTNTTATEPSKFQGSEGYDEAMRNSMQQREKQQPVVAEPKIGRNDACPCGSGKKYKQCHGK